MHQTLDARKLCRLNNSVQIDHVVCGVCGNSGSGRRNRLRGGGMNPPLTSGNTLVDPDDMDGGESGGPDACFGCGEGRGRRGCGGEHAGPDGS